MNDLATDVYRDHNSQSWEPIPRIAIYVLVPLFFIGLSFSIFILVVVQNFSVFLFFLLLSGLVVSFIAWNASNWRRQVAVLCFLRSFPDTDLSAALDGQLVKISGHASCGTVSLESSYERATRCIYTSTLLYECGGFVPKPANAHASCLKWSLTYCERFSTDFYVTDQKSGVRAMVKAGYGSKVVPLIVDTKLVATTRQCRALSPPLRKWLQDKSLSTEPRLLCLEEGYIQEGSSVTVIGVLHRNDGILMIVQPQELLSTGCLWQKLLLPVEFDGLVLGMLN